MAVHKRVLLDHSVWLLIGYPTRVCELYLTRLYVRDFAIAVTHLRMEIVSKE